MNGQCISKHIDSKTTTTYKPHKAIINYSKKHEGMWVVQLIMF